MQLIQAKRVPKGRATFVKAWIIKNTYTNCSILFEPDRCWMNDLGLLNQVLKQMLKDVSIFWLATLLRKPRESLLA